MISARATLHLAALLMPMVPVVLWLGAIGRLLDEGSAIAASTIAVPASLAAQTASLWRWNALQRRAIAKRSAWPTGVGMAALTHLFFGVYLAVAFIVFVGPEEWMGSGQIWKLPMQAAFFSFSSLMIAGWVSLPLTAWLAHAIGRKREKELALESC